VLGEGYHYHPHFTDEETEVGLLSVRAEIRMRCLYPTGWTLNHDTVFPFLGQHMAECELDFTVTRPALYLCALDIPSERSGGFPISRVTLRGLVKGMETFAVQMIP